MEATTLFSSSMKSWYWSSGTIVDFMADMIALMHFSRDLGHSVLIVFSSLSAHGLALAERTSANITQPIVVVLHILDRCVVRTQRESTALDRSVCPSGPQRAVG